MHIAYKYKENNIKKLLTINTALDNVGNETFMYTRERDESYLT